MTWIAKEDAASGKTYYYNKETRETTWKRPDDFLEPIAAAAVASAAPSSAVPGDAWTEKVDPNSGKAYYYNKVTKETTWTRPAAMAAHTEAVSQPSVPPAVTPPAGKEEWVPKVDPASGKTYYYNKATKATTWTNPAAPTADAATTGTDATPQTNQLTTDGVDWAIKTDDRTGRKYQYNIKTKETKWLEPSPGATPTASRHETPNRQREEEVTAATPQVAKVSAIPEPWVEKLDPSSGKPFYYNRVTKETTWTSPAMETVDGPPKAAPPGGVPPLSSPRPAHAEWLERVDPKSGKVYYYNSETRETSWKKPGDVEGGDASRPLQQQDAVTGAAGSKPPVAASSTNSLPASAKSSNWVRKVDYRSGQYMYHNVVTGETQWTDPNDAQPLLTLPLTAEAIFVIGGNAKPSPAQQDRQPPGTTFQTVEMLDGKQWSVLQASYLAEKVPSSVLPVPVLPCDVDDITVIPTSRTDCVMFGKRTADHAPFCMQWNSETLQRSSRFDLQGLVAYGAAFAAVSGGVIATGGYLDDTMQNVASDAIVMDFQTSRPFLLPKMNIKRANHAIAVLDLSNADRLMWFAYVFGGFDGQRKSSSVERYVAGKGSWEVMENMPVARAGHAAVAVDRTMYVLGGRSGYSVLADVHSMHVQSDHWRNVKPMHHARCNFGAVYVGSFLVVVGGWDGTRLLDSVEAYDPRIDVWRKVTSLPHPKQHIGLVVLRKVLPNGATIVDSVR